jgi:hypothetical protein
MTSHKPTCPPLATHPMSQQEKANRWDRLIRLLQNPEIRDTYIWHLSTMRRAVEVLLARREELPPALVAELISYKVRLEALHLEAIDGFTGVEGVLNFFPTYVTESLVGQLCQGDAGYGQLLAPDGPYRATNTRGSPVSSELAGAGSG